MDIKRICSSDLLTVSQGKNANSANEFVIDFDQCNHIHSAFQKGHIDTAMSIYLSSPSSSDETAFAYKPLSAEADTRLLELEPAPDASFPLQCRISEICLSSDDSIEYEALSYTWGAPKFPETLHVIEDEDKTSVVKITRISGTLCSGSD